MLLPARVRGIALRSGGGRVRQSALPKRGQVPGLRRQLRVPVPAGVRRR